MTYSEDNKQKLLALANDPRYYIGTDERGIEWSRKILEDGTELWVSSRNGIIQNGGINNPPHMWNERTGLSFNIYNRERKRK